MGDRPLLFSQTKKFIQFWKRAVPHLEPNTVEFKQVKNLLVKPADRDIAIKEFLTSQNRALIKESFELIKNHCDETKRDSRFKGEPWY